MGLRDSIDFRGVALAAAAAPLAQALKTDGFGDALNNVGITNAIAQDVTRGLISGVATQRLRMAMYHEGKLDYASIAADAFGNALGNSLVAQMQSSYKAAQIEAEQKRSGKEDADAQKWAYENGKSANEENAGGGLRLGGGTGLSLSGGAVRDFTNQVVNGIVANASAQDNNPVSGSDLVGRQGDDVSGLPSYSRLTVLVREGDNPALLGRRYYGDERAGASILAASGLDSSVYGARHLPVGQVLSLPDSYDAQAGGRLIAANNAVVQEDKRLAQEQRAQAVTVTTQGISDGKAAAVQATTQNIGDNIGDLRNQADRFNKQASQLAAAAVYARSQGLSDAADAYQLAANAAYYQARSASSQALDLSAAKQWAMPQYSSSNLFSEGWNTGEYSAGAPYARGNRQPDYLSMQANLYVASVGLAINLHNAEPYGQFSLGRQYPAFSEKPGVSAMLGFIDGANDAQSTSNFLEGAGWQANAIVPVIGPVGIGGGINHSYGGATAVELGIGTPGRSVAPFSYGWKLKKPDDKP